MLGGNLGSLLYGDVSMMTCNEVLFRIIQTNLSPKISFKDRRINKNMSEKVFAKIIFSQFHIIKQLFIQIMCNKSINSD